MLLSCPAKRHPSIGERGRLFHSAPSVFDGQMPVDRSRCARSIWFIQAPTLPTRSTATFAPSRTYIRPATSPPSAISSPMPPTKTAARSASTTTASRFYVWPVLPAGSAPAECRRDTLRGCAQWPRPRSSRRLRLVGGHITNLGLRHEALIGRISLATTWKRYVPAAAGKRVPRGLSGEAWTPRVGHSIIGIPVVAEKHCCAMQ